MALDLCPLFIPLEMVLGLRYFMPHSVMRALAKSVMERLSSAGSGILNAETGFSGSAVA